MTGLGDGPVEPEFRKQLNQLANVLDTFFNGDVRGAQREIGFIVMMFRLNDETGRCNYISNAQRTDVVRMLKEQIKRFEELQKN